MSRLPLMVLGCVVLTGWAMAQTTTTVSTDLRSQTPTENLTGAGSRSPGTWVRAAIARHIGLMGIRLTGPRFGEPNTEEAAARFGGGSSATGTNGGLSGLDALLNLASQFGVDTSALGGLMGGTTGGSGTVGGTTGGTIPPPSNGTNYTLEDLIRLGQMYEAGSGMSTGTQKGVAGTMVTAQTSDDWTRDESGAVGRLPKPAYRLQGVSSLIPQTTEELDFRTRWANSLLQTFFTVLSTGLTSSAMVTVIKDALRPLMFPDVDSEGNDDGDGSGGDDSGGDGGGSGGSGIEDNPPGGGGGGGSTI